ncbi:5-formyltetrahydrofolate cyclo-ligase [Robiginitalea myxolifaciens]|uniref:5-formyltetrahydrofolate cyclo-ligase n=1 Tax=Robiginitalea myxolifaciens TaxID=400055 RepID=A0A1I6G6F1_9FLAO|nr:5-formyltetrahydrofolate cyclo-ligase [Robiginitalea myxolifaciens]SFR37762.1 5-formyltetrahydrofolate cyclo-ligase [Robiginitalea myxolifaciens]
MLKQDLRLSHLQLRDQLSDSEVLLKSKDLLRQSLNLPIWNHQIFHVFLSIPEKREVQTNLFISHLNTLGKRVVIPKIIGSGLLENYLLEPNTTLKKNPWGIPEPVSGQVVASGEIDVVFLPLLAYDPHGHRVGYGGGYYDRFLAQCRPETLLIGLSFFPPAAAISDLEPTDLPMDYCINPDGIIKFQ